MTHTSRRQRLHTFTRHTLGDTRSPVHYARRLLIAYFASLCLFEVNGVGLHAVVYSEIAELARGRGRYALLEMRADAIGARIQSGYPTMIRTVS